VIPGGAWDLGLDGRPAKGPIRWPTGTRVVGQFQTRHRNPAERQKRTAVQLMPRQTACGRHLHLSKVARSHGRRGRRQSASTQSDGAQERLDPMCPTPGH
jgi:hypothetical protein